VVRNAYAGFGLPAEAPGQFEFPHAMGLEGGDLSPIRENIDKLVAGLTTWRPTITSKGFYPAPLVSAEGADYAEAYSNVHNLFLQNLWGDGLPITPPTEARVRWVLRGTDLSPETVIAKVNPRGGTATVHSLAVNLAMAGGRPEYLPFLIGVVKAVTEPKFQLENVSPSSNSNYIAAIVNGPAAKEIRLNSGYSLIGPDSAHPAGGCIGRALAFVLQNLGGAIPGLSAMELFGGLRHTNGVFAEDEAGLPKGWDSIAVERGFTPHDNVVSVLPVSSAVNVTIMISDYKDAQAAAVGYLNRIAGIIAAPNMNLLSANTNHKTPDYSPGLLLLPRTWAEQLTRLGWDKHKLKVWLRENTTQSWKWLQKCGMSEHAAGSTGASPTRPAYVAETPEQMRIVVAGGAQSAHAYWMQVGKNTQMSSAQIQLPANWKELIQDAERDLGPAPVA